MIGLEPVNVDQLTCLAPMDLSMRVSKRQWLITEVRVCESRYAGLVGHFDKVLGLPFGCPFGTQQRASVGMSKGRRRDE